MVGRLGLGRFRQAQHIGGLTIRSLAEKLGVKPMSLYHYVANKDEILDAIDDRVYGEIELPLPGSDWQAEMRRRAISARQGAPASSVGDPAPAVAYQPWSGDAAAP